MNNEETILDPQYNAESQNKETANVEQSKADEKKNASWGEKATYAAGGAVVGAGMTLAGQTVAAISSADELAETELPVEPQENKEEEVAAATTNATESEEENVTNATTNIVDESAAPDPEDAIVATATGVRVAQVDDDASFSQAFADARAQVGPGGVFEWHGRAYSTYYKDEWDNMTTEEKQEYQASIDYRDVISDDSVAEHYNDLAQNHAHHSEDAHYTANQEPETEVQAEPESDTDTEAIAVANMDEGSDDVDVQVLQVGQTDLNGDGIPENAAVLEINGHEVLIVDVDQDGIADAAICDVDNDGELEVADLSGENMAMPDQTSGDAYMAQADDAPDYMNDANVGMYEA